ncbi:hypothetical protein JCM8547_000771 [Rhodosporidiobolus lusitaniae]
MPRYSTASASDSDHPALSDSPLHSPLPSSSSTHFTPHPNNHAGQHPSQQLYGALPTLASLARPLDSTGPGGGGDEEDDEDEEAWDEVDIPQAVEGSSRPAEAAAAAAAGEGIEIVISKGGGKGKKGKGDKKKLGSTLLERKIRQERHKVHVLSLLAMAMVRNRWLNDAELQARLLSQVPSPLLSAFTSITRAAYPNVRDRSRLFERALADLVSWFYRAFEVEPEKDLLRRDTGEVEEDLKGWEEEWERLTRKEGRRREKVRKVAEEKEEKERDRKGKRKAVNQDAMDEDDNEKEKGDGLPPVEEAYLRYPWEEHPVFSLKKRAKLLAAQSSLLSASTSSSSSSKPPPTHPTYPLIRPFTSSLSSSTSSSPSGGPSFWEPLNPPSSSSPSSQPRTSSVPPALYAAAALLRGSHDLQAQLFVALLRAVDVPARLVVSLQGVEWRSKGAQKSGGRGGGGGGGGGGQGKGGRKKGVGGLKGGVMGKGKGKKKEESEDEYSSSGSSSSDQEARRKKAPKRPSPTKAKAVASSANGKAKASASSTASSAKPRPKTVTALSASESAPSASSSRASSAKPPTLSSSSSRKPSVKPSAISSSSSSSRKPKPKPDSEVLVLSSTASSASETDDGWKDGHGKLSYKPPPVNLRKGLSGAAKQKAWEKEHALQFRRSASPDAEELATPPTQWTEAYTRYNKEWIVVDVSRKRVRCRGIMEPKPPGGKAGGAGRVMCYVVALEEDHSVHDVTPRYSSSFTNTTLKLRVPTSTVQRQMNGGGDWFAGVVKRYERKFKLERDKLEEEELWKRMKNEPFPSSLGGFKNHPNYVLQLHLHQNESLLPTARSIGLFKGQHAVFRRSDVVAVKSRDNWYRQGRLPRSNEIPRKWVKVRAVTINNKRREEMAKLEGLEEETQGLWSEEQTEVFVPEPVKEGKVPKNDFGNIDLFVPSMLPAGAVHLPSKVAAKCAKQLNIDYAEAITGYEFRQRRANPIMSGVVVAAEHAETLEDAITALELSTREKELAKQQDRVLKRWKKLILGLRIRQRLLDQFGGDLDKADEEAVKAATKEEGKKRGRKKGNELGGGTVRPEEKVRANGEEGKKPAAARKKRPAPSPSPSPTASQLDEADYKDDAPPPRKRAAASSSTAALPTEGRKTRSSTRATRSTRSTRSSAVDGEERDAGTSLKVRLRMPGLSSPAKPVEEEEEEREKRPTRASAAKARGKLRLEEEDEDEDAEEAAGEVEDEEDEEEDEMELVEPTFSSAPATNGAGGGFLPDPALGSVDTGGGFFLDEADGAGEAKENSEGVFLAKPEQASGFLVDEADGQPGQTEVQQDDENEDDFGFEYESD